MSGFCVAKTEGHANLCIGEQCFTPRYCRDYERGKIAPTYPVPAVYNGTMFLCTEGYWNFLCQ